MPRAKPEVPAPDALRALVAGGRLAVRVTPGARSEGLTIDSGRVLAKVRARPQDGAANAAVCALVAAALGLSPTKVSLLRGATSREKLLQVDG